MKKINILERNKFTYSIREAFKTLRTNLLFSGSDVKTILLTSCLSNEGKSTVSLELAKSLAAASKKVLLIDADLRKSVFVTRYTDTTESILGLSELLSAQAKLEDVLYETNVDNLHVIFAGAVPPNPVELLGSRQFDEFLHDIRDSYDYVLIDVSPLGLVIDASVVSSFCDGAVLIIAANEISYKFAADVKGQLEKGNCKVLGAVLNRVPVKSSGRYGRYYGQKYGRYGTYGNMNFVESNDIHNS
ncbi:MAG: polysaccharide biosynthesis tyrosine autokinase [Clostridia bacterium]|nr:polysaccharide biosynthesis tyrosine autokinase [Clostridia bacterium]